MSENIKKATQESGQVYKQDDIEIAAAALTGLHKDTIKLAFNAVWDMICHELELGNSVKLHGKGKFYLSRRSSRIGRNPITKQEYTVPAREAMAFQTSPAYAKRLRERRKAIEEQQRAEQESASSDPEPVH